MSTTIASIIICTNNRAAHLALTLRAIGQLSIPPHLQPELIVADNASTDNTPDVVRAANLSNMLVRYVHAPQRGKGHAYNAGIAASQGDILIFTDDDIRPDGEWLPKICEPILRNVADGVQGAIVIPPSHRRPWMLPFHLELLASTEQLAGQPVRSLIGANMAIGRHVLHKIPLVDTRLGPGALGYLEDSLFAMQMLEASYRLTYAPDAVVEHHFDMDRLNAESFRGRTVRDGRSRAYISYHWLHESFPDPVARQRAVERGKFKHFLLRPWQLRKSAIMSQAEFWLYIETGFWEQWLIEQQTPRRYARRGLSLLENADTSVAQPAMNH